MNLKERIEMLEQRQGRGFDATAAKIIQDATATESELEVFDEVWTRLPGESDCVLKQRVTAETMKLSGRAVTQKVMLEVSKAMFLKEHAPEVGESQSDFENRVLKVRKELLKAEKARKELVNSEKEKRENEEK